MSRTAILLALLALASLTPLATAEITPQSDLLNPTFVLGKGPCSSADDCCPLDPTYYVTHPYGVTNNCQQA